MAADLKVRYEQKRFHVEEEDDMAENIWQLLYPRHFANVYIKKLEEKGIIGSRSIMYAYIDRIYFQQDENDSSDFCFESFISDVFIDEPLQHKNETDIKNSNIILVNGAPGMGKSTLCKEIAFQWAKENKILKSAELIFLIHMCDSKVLRIDSLEDFIHYFYDFEPAALEVAKHYAKLLNNCKNITIILDGYNKCCDTHSSLLIKHIINRQVLPHSKLVITPHPSALKWLQYHAVINYEILGFNNQTKVDYIDKEFQHDPKKSLELKSYLESHTDIKNVCSIPIIMSVLIFIFQRRAELPRNQIELYDVFVRFVISRCRQRIETSLSKVLPQPINQLPQVYQDYLLQLSKLAYEHMKNEQFVFSEEDVNAVCSNFTLTDKNFYGLDLLRYTRCYDDKKEKEQIYCNFIHLSVQKYLAAYYISSLKPYSQFQLLKETFFVDRYLNIWIMFALMNKTKMLDCQKALVYSDTQVITEEEKVKLCLLFTNLFNGVHVEDLRVSSDSTLIKFICYQADYCTLQESFAKTDIFMTNLVLSKTANGTDQVQIYLLHESGWNASYEKIKQSLISKYCNLEVMIIENDALIGCRIGQNHLCDSLIGFRINQHHNDPEINIILHSIIFYYCHVSIKMIKLLSYCVKYLQHFIITNSTIDKFKLSMSDLVKLILEDNNISAMAIDDLKDLIERNKSLQFVSLSNNNLQSSAFILLRALKKLTKLEEFNLCNNNVGEQAAEYLADVVENNRSIKTLRLGGNNLQRATNIILQTLKRISTLRILDLDNNNITGRGAEDIANVIRNNTFLEELGLGSNDLKSSAIVILQALRKTKTLKILNLENNKMTSEVTKVLAEIIRNNSDLEWLYLSNNDFKSYADEVLQALKENSKLKALDLDSNNMTETTAESIADVIKKNPSLEQLCLADNDLKLSTNVILQALQENSKLKVLNLSKNNMTDVDVIAKSLANVLKSNTSLEKLYLADNELKSSIIIIVKALQENSALKALSLSKNGLTSEVAEGLAGVVQSNTLLEQLFLADNDLKLCAPAILQALKRTSHLRTLDLSKNGITSDMVTDLADIIQSNTHLQSLNLADNDLKSSATVILQALKGNSKLKMLNLSNNDMTGTVAEILADVIQNHALLETLVLSNNNLQSSAVKIVQSLKGHSKLKILNLDNNNMTGDITDYLADIMKRNDDLKKFL